MKARFLLRFLRVRLAWKIAGANAVLLLALGALLYLRPLAGSSAVLNAALVLVGLSAAFAINAFLITLALQPIRELERTSAALWSGALEVRAQPSALADRDLMRVAGTINNLLETLAADRSRLKRLTESLLEARESERAAVAREITESAAQAATALALECAVLRANGAQDSQRRVERVQRAATGLADELRRIARDLYPRHIDQLGLDTALRSLVRETCNGGPQECVYSTRGLTATTEALPRPVALALYDVAREALLNARKHAEASRIDVSLGLERHAARLSIVDDGRGFDASNIDPDRPGGLNVLRERMALVGGTLEIHSAARKGVGTRLVAVVPITTAPEEAPPSLTAATEEQHSW